MRWPVEETGRNSVRPSTMPIRAALSSKSVSIPRDYTAWRLKSSGACEIAEFAEQIIEVFVAVCTASKCARSCGGDNARDPPLHHRGGFRGLLQLPHGKPIATAWACRLVVDRLEAQRPSIVNQHAHGNGDACQNGHRPLEESNIACAGGAQCKRRRKAAVLEKLGNKAFQHRHRSRRRTG